MRLPIRVRLTAAFALATMATLACAAIFVTVRLRDDRDDAVDASLRARSANAIESYASSGRIDSIPLEDPEESFVQAIDADGVVLDTAGFITEPALDAAGLADAFTGIARFERRFDGIDGRARALARASRDRSAVIVVGQSLNDRNDAMRNVVTSFVIGGVASLIVASAVGYALATAAFAPVDAIRRRAREISLGAPDVKLPVPEIRDEIHKLAETLNEMLARLQASFERERRFIAVASHELRTPIAVLRAEIDNLQNTRGDERDTAAALEAASRECDHLARLANDLLILARTTDDGLSVRREEQPIAPLLGEARDRVAEIAAREGRYVHLEVDRDLVATVDRERVRQLLDNLLDNAIRHGSGDVKIRSERSADTVTIEVSDSGPGFGDDIVARAFEPFARGRATTRTAGSGLGLAIVRAIAEAHAGTATIVTGGTTTVRVTFPADA